MNVSGAMLASELPNGKLTPGNWYWVTYKHSRWTESFFGNRSDPIGLQATDKLKCEAVNGDLGLFETHIGMQWVHYTKCVLTTPPEEKKGFWDFLK